MAASIIDSIRCSGSQSDDCRASMYPKSKCSAHLCVYRQKAFPVYTQNEKMRDYLLVEIIHKVSGILLLNIVVKAFSRDTPIASYFMYQFKSRK